jgi:hypothetical protein
MTGKTKVRDLKKKYALDGKSETYRASEVTNRLRLGVVPKTSDSTPLAG